MTSALPLTAATVPGASLAARLASLPIAPRTAYAAVAADPRWGAALLAVLAMTAVPMFMMLSTAVGQQAFVDELLQTVEAFGGSVSDERYRQVQELAPRARYAVAAAQVIGLPLGLLAVAGVAFGVLTGWLGGAATFRQVFAIATFSSALFALRTVVTMPLNYARESLSSPSSLAALVPAFDDGTFGARLLGALDLFTLWWGISLAIGLGVLYRRPAGPIALTAVGLSGALALAIAAIRSYAGA